MQEIFQEGVSDKICKLLFIGELRSGLRILRIDNWI